VKHRSNAWALVLAGGEGSRLHGITRNVRGVAVPKQFCSLQGGASLLQEALQRASVVAPMQRVCTVVAEQHRQWWTSMLGNLPDSNIVVQPQNRGTAHGILLPLLRIATLDPDATVVILPADHYLRDEEIMAASLRHGAELANADRDSIYLLGVEPDEPDSELGYVLPALRTPHNAAKVVRFFEKPSEDRARALIEQGALWNVFIIAASVRALLSLFDASFDATKAAMRGAHGVAIENVYRQLLSVDFSRDILQGNESRLKVLRVPHCGWTDLGTIRRIGLTLQHLEQDDIRPARRPYFPSHLNLADQYARLNPARDYSAKFGSLDLRA
jgi:mannose-1-phosphate guanylyltransferase